MSSKSRWVIFLISTPLVVFTAVGGLLGASAAQSESFTHLKVFEDVVSLIVSAYVEPVDADKVMEGAMRGLADGLDPASAYLTPDDVATLQAGTPLPAGDVGLTVTRQFYLRVVGVRDGSPAARAGLRTGDYIRAIDGKPTRDVSAFTGTRWLHGDPGSKVELTVIRGNAADPHVMPLVREAPARELVTGRTMPTGEGYVRIVSFREGAAAALRSRIAALQKSGVAMAVIDLRGVADGPPEEGIAAARLFVKEGTIAIRQGRGPDRTTIEAGSGDGALTLPIVLLVSNGTANAAEVFAAALDGHDRADLVGEPTAGLAALQHLVLLPENRGLWMTYERYLTLNGDPLHERGLRPDVVVEEPVVGFDETPPATDEPLNTALARLHGKS